MQLFDVRQELCDSEEIASLHGCGTAVIVRKKDGTTTVGEFRTEARAKIFLTNVKGLLDVNR